MKIAVHVNVKNENRLVEFIDYYLNIGFDYFVIMDDDSEKDAKQLLLDNNIDKTKFDVLYTNGRNFRNEVYNKKEHWDYEILPLLKQNEIDYVFHIDADEFLHLGKFKNISEIIYHYSPFDSLRINWLMFGSNGIIKNDSDSIIYKFNKSDTNLHSTIKSITKVISIYTDGNLNPHAINIKPNGIVKNILNEIVEDNTNIHIGLFLDKNDAPIYLAHYMLQDARSFINRKIYLPIFLLVTQNYLPTNLILENIKKNEDDMIDYLSSNLHLNREEKLDRIHTLTDLPKNILFFLKEYYHFWNKNIIENNDIIESYDKTKQQ